MEELDLTSYDIEEPLQELLREEILTNCIHKGKTILKVNASKIAESSTVQEIPDVSPDEEFGDDFTDFKKFVTNSLTKLSEKIESLSCSASTQVKKFNCKSCDGKEAVVSILRQELKELRLERSPLLDIILTQNKHCSNSQFYSHDVTQLSNKCKISARDNSASNNPHSISHEAYIENNSLRNSLEIQLNDIRKTKQNEFCSKRNIVKGTVRNVVGINDSISSELPVNEKDISSAKRVNNVRQFEGNAKINTIKVMIKRPQVVVNNHPENQTVFKKLPLIPGEKRYSDAVTSTAKKNDILIFTDSLPKGIRMYEFNRSSKHGNAKLLCFPGAKSHQLLHYIDVNLDGRKPPDSVIIHIGVNDVMYDNSQSNIENLVRNIKKMTEKCRNAGAKNVFISGLVYTTRVSLSILERIHETLLSYCDLHNCIYIDNRNIRGKHLYKDGLHLLESGKEILANNFLFYLNRISNVNIEPNSNLWRYQCRDTNKEGYDSSAKEVLSKLRVKQVNKLIIGNLNINSIP